MRRRPRAAVMRRLRRAGPREPSGRGRALDGMTRASEPGQPLVVKPAGGDAPYRLFDPSELEDAARAFRVRSAKDARRARLGGELRAFFDDELPEVLEAPGSLLGEGFSAEASGFEVRHVRLGQNLDFATVVWEIRDGDRRVPLPPKQGGGRRAERSSARRRAPSAPVRSLVASALVRAVPRLRYRIGEALNPKRVPKLHFVYEPSEAKDAVALERNRQTRRAAVDFRHRIERGLAASDALGESVFGAGFDPAAVAKK